MLVLLISVIWFWVLLGLGMEDVDYLAGYKSRLRDGYSEGVMNYYLKNEWARA